MKSRLSRGRPKRSVARNSRDRMSGTRAVWLWRHIRLANRSGQRPHAGERGTHITFTIRYRLPAFWKRLVPKWLARPAIKRALANFGRQVTRAEMPIVGSLLNLRGLPARLARRGGASLRRVQPILEQALLGSFVLPGEEPHRELVVGTL